MRPLIEDVLDVLQEIHAAYTPNTSGGSVSALRQQAVRTVAARELAGHRFKNRDSAEKSIHDACTRRLNLAVSEFDALVHGWLSGDPGDLQSRLRTVDGYVQKRPAVESLLASRSAAEEPIIEDAKAALEVFSGRSIAGPRSPSRVWGFDRPAPASAQAVRSP